MSNHNTETPDLGSLQAEHECAMQQYRKTRTDFLYARSIHIDALNKLNESQKALDKAVESLRGNAPQDSDWGES